MRCRIFTAKAGLFATSAKLRTLTGMYDAEAGGGGYGSSSRHSGSSGRVNHDTDTTNLTGLVPGAVTFQTTDDMVKMFGASAAGTVAYITDEEALLVRVINGWQYIALGSLLPVTTQSPSTSAPPPTTTPQPVKPEVESFKLIDGNLRPSLTRFLRLAALNEPWTGDMHGVRGADYSCHRQARRAGLHGTFRAFLSTRIQSLNSVVRYEDWRLPIINTKGDVLFGSWRSLFDGDGGTFPQQIKIYSFSGKNILTDYSWPQKVIWHGSDSTGERVMDTFCEGWHSDRRDEMGLASSLINNKLLDQEKFHCDSRLAVLCIETTSQMPRGRRRRVIRNISSDDEKEEVFHELSQNVSHVK
ncbi:collagen alpha-1(XV) chain-like [Anabrus simplex]|uniref:collagen alpha-1(XV) chain-like n=1 Tax=Anabrus simplex TaxID=316456 RepID=UPI0034DD2007